MAIYCKKTAQKLPISLEEAWNFLSSPYNLKTITPEHMGFKIKNDVKAMYEGEDYDVKLDEKIKANY